MVAWDTLSATLRRSLCNFIRYSKHWFYIIMFLMGTIIIVQFSTVNVYAERIGYLFQIFNIVGITLLCYSGRKKYTNKFNRIFVFLYLIVYWYYLFALSNSGETMPYITYWN